MSITEFLEARIAEDEALANACLTKEALTPYSDERIPPVKPEEWGGLVVNYLGGPMGDHCARHNPTRVLAECAAKRAIIEAHPVIVELWWEEQCEIEVCETCQEDSYPDQWPCPTIAALAAVYKGHADYQQEWASEA